MLSDGSVHLGYNGVDGSHQSSPDDRFFFRFDPIRRPLMSLTGEGEAAARQIREAHPGLPIYVFYSGGIDSEAVLLSFVRAGIPVTAVVIEYENDLNRYDIEFAHAFVARYPDLLTLRRVGLNLKNWIRSREARDLAVTGQTLELAQTPIFKVASDHCRDGLVITGYQEPQVARRDGPTRWVYYHEEIHYSIAKFCRVACIEAVPSFFQWNTELISAWLTTSHHLALYAGFYNRTVNDTRNIKSAMLCAELQLSPRRKVTGFEGALGELVTWTKRYQEGLPHRWNQVVELEVYSALLANGVKLWN